MKLDIVLIEHDLSCLLEIIQDLKSMSVLSPQAEGTLLNMFSEICKVYVSIRDLLSPYYLMKNEEGFKKKLAETLDDYKRDWLDENDEINSERINDIDLSCTRVQGMLNDFSNKIDWKSIKPSTKNQFERIKDLQKFWFLNDGQIYEIMRDLLIQLRDGLSDVNSAGSDQESFTLLQTFISEAKPWFERIESHVDNLCKKKQ